MLDITMHNVSMEIINNSTEHKQQFGTSTNKKRGFENENKNLDIKKIEKTDPYKDLTEE